MAKKAYPLRLDEQVMKALQRWADDDLRSLNQQIEYLLRDALVNSGRVKLVQKVVTILEENDSEGQSPKQEK